VPERVGVKERTGLNRRFIVYRYVPIARYWSHIDGAWPLSGIPSLPRQPFTHPEKEEVLPTPVEGCKYEYDSNPDECKQRSPFALIIYLMKITRVERPRPSSRPRNKACLTRIPCMQ
jgi:hypothetical protein